MPGHWQPVARDTWVPPSDCDGLLLLGKYLRLGAWKFYLAPAPIDPSQLPDLFSATPREVLDFVESHSMPVLIDSIANDVEWRIVVEPSAVPGAVAA